MTIATGYLFEVVCVGLNQWAVKANGNVVCVRDSQDNANEIADILESELSPLQEEIEKLEKEADAAATDRMEWEDFAGNVARSVCLDQRIGDKCICFSCEAKRLLKLA